MQKKLIALAIAGLSSAAFAQSNVTIYGVADASFENVAAGGSTAFSNALGSAGLTYGNNNPVGAATTINVTTGLTGGVAGTGYGMNSRNRLTTNSSLIGFKGSESVGGMTVVYQFETGVNLDTAGLNTAGSLLGGQRDSLVGIAGAFGTIAGGYVSTPHRNLMASMDLAPGATGITGAASIIGRVNVGAALNPITAAGQTANSFGSTTITSYSTGGTNLAQTTSTIANNVGTIFRTQGVAYITPDFNGLSGVVAYVPNESKDNSVLNRNQAGGGATRNPGGWNAAVNYNNGPLKVGLSYLHLQDAVLTGMAGAHLGGGSGTAATAVNAIMAASNLGYTGAETHNTWLLGAQYTFGGATTVSFMYDHYRGTLGTVDTATAATVNSIGRNSWYLGLKHSMGAHDFTVSYAKAGDNSVGFVGAAPAGFTFGSDGASQWGLRYAYNMSKRSSVYLQYAQINNKTNGNYDLNPGSSSGAVVGTSAAATTGVLAGSDPRAFGAGIRHSF